MGTHTQMHSITIITYRHKYNCSQKILVNSVYTKLV